MTIEVLKRSLFAKNERAADANRAMLSEHGVLCINILGSPGCGKTALLEALIPLLPRTVRAAVLEGDLATTRDAERIGALGVPVIQLLTEGGCHLTATLVEQGLRRLPLDELDVVFIENVGNAVCPANFDLGEHARWSVLSVTEGDDKPAKYAHLFQVADVVVITKSDLLVSTDFDLGRAQAELRALVWDRPVLLTSRKDAASVCELRDWVLARVGEHSTHAALVR